jgi:hypothetical protein
MALSGVNNGVNRNAPLPLETDRPTSNPVLLGTTPDRFEAPRTSGQNPTNGGSAAVLLAQANGNRPQDRTYDYTLPNLGNVRVTETTVLERNPDGTTFNKRVFTIQPGGNGGPPINRDSAGDFAAEFSQAAHYLFQGGNLNGQPPRTVRLAYNQTTGAGVIERWHGTDQPGSGRLGGLAVLSGNGWNEVPRGILDALPVNVATDVLRQGGTTIFRGADAINQPYWAVQYTNQDSNLTSLTFNGAGQLARQNTRFPDGRIQSDFHPPYDALRFRSNGISVEDRGTTQYTQNGAIVLNERGDVRTEYALVSSNPNSYSEVRTIEHLYANGQATDLRLVTDARSGQQTLVRADASGNLSELGALQQNPDGTRSLPLNEATRAFSGQALTSASGTSLGVSTQEAGSASWSWSDAGHLVLDIAGLVPVIGEAADVANAIWYAGEGKYLEAGLSLLSVIPGVGDLLGKGGKLVLNALPTPAIAKALVEGISKIDLPKFIDNLRNHPQLGRFADNIGRALDEWIGGLQRIVVRSELPASLAAKLDDTQLANLLKGLDGAGIASLAGRLGDDVVARMATHLDGASVLKITDYFDGHGQIEAVRRMSNRSGAELAAANRAVDLELLDGPRSHSLFRHGPDLTDQQLTDRLKTGIGSDGNIAPTDASTRFTSYQDWLNTRLAAEQDFLARSGLPSLTTPPTPGMPIQFPSSPVTHAQPVGDGFVGTGTPVRASAQRPNGTAQNFNVYTEAAPVTGLTQTQTGFTWDATLGRWRMGQHFPVGRGVAPTGASNPI